MTFIFKKDVGPEPCRVSQRKIVSWRPLVMVQLMVADDTSGTHSASLAAAGMPHCRKRHVPTPFSANSAPSAVHHQCYLRRNIDVHRGSHFIL